MQITPRDKKILVAAGIAIPVLLIAYFLFLRPGGEEVALPTGPTGVTGATGWQPTETPSASPSETPRETLPPVELAGARDPFSIPPGLELAPSGSVSPSVSPTVGPTVSPTVSPTVYPTIPPSGSPSPSVSPTPPPPEEPGNKILIGGHNVVLHSIADGRKVDVSVDGVVYTVEAGATFDDNFMLVSIDGKCARFLFGDQGFELCL